MEWEGKYGKRRKRKTGSVLLELEPGLGWMAVFNLYCPGNLLWWKSPNPLLMCHYCLSTLAFLCLAAVSGAAAGKESPEQPAVFVSLDGWETNMRRMGPFSTPGWSFSMKLKVMEVSPSWKVVDVEESGARLALADSEGSSLAGPRFSYSSSRSSEQPRWAGTVCLETDSWLPSEGAGWVEARGEIPFIMSSDSAVSESVALKVTVKDCSVPLVLRNAGMGGKDVTVELKGFYEKGADGGEAHILRVGMSSSVPLGFLGFELCSPDGAPLLAENYGSSSGRSRKHYDWEWHFRMQDDKMEELKVSVKYAAGLKKIMVPVNVRCGMFEAGEQQDNRNRED